MDVAAHPRRDSWRLDGHTALVTGASRGIGLACARELAALGANIAMVSRDAADLEQARAELAEECPAVEILALAADLAEDEERQAVYDWVRDLALPLSLLINNAGTNTPRAALDYTPEEWHALVATNLESAWEMCRLAHPDLVQHAHAAIVNIGSVSGITHVRTGALYGMTKAALHQMTRNLACEWADDGIRVNAGAMVYPHAAVAVGACRFQLSGRSACTHADSAHRRARRSCRGCGIFLPACGQLYHRRGAGRRRRLPQVRFLKSPEHLAPHGRRLVCGRVGRYGAFMAPSNAAAKRDLPVCERTRRGWHARLAYRPPYDYPGMLAFFARRAIAGIEEVDAPAYRRRFVLDDAPGVLTVRPCAGDAALALHLAHPSARVRPQVVSRVRQMFDLDADMDAIGAVLERDRRLRALAWRHPSVRVPGAFDDFEIAIRAVIGQQISVTRARTLLTRLVAHHGDSFTTADGATGCAFPTPAALAAADLRGIGLMPTRAATLKRMAQAVDEGCVSLARGQDLEAFVDDWTALSGIGPWTAHYIAMRALGHPDAFPAADLGLRKAAGDGAPMSARDLQQCSQPWRPWRAYAAALLWRTRQSTGEN
jgi:3-methyladenine DNA glycosylase/8-oxoguanine DNA glycosylase/NAD(P)-dependent dehydrogenase (short-subunit alcohol dehydrogenase family)